MKFPSSVSLLPIFGAALFLSYNTPVSSEDVTIINRCSQSLYIKSRSVNFPPFHLPPNSPPKTVTANRIPRDAPIPRPRIWAVTGCDSNGGNCDTSDNILSLAEFNYEETGQIWYDVSQVDGYTLPITMNVPGNSVGNCKSASCSFNIDQNCPQQNKVTNKGKVVSCENKERDNPSTAYVENMKRSCPGVYTWSRDNQAGMRDCSAGGNNALTITFC